MKTKEKKLTLTRDTIATLTDTQLVSIQGGTDTGKPCQMETCFTDPLWGCPITWPSC